MRDNGAVADSSHSVDRLLRNASERAEAIRDRRLDIYMNVEALESSLFYPDEELEVFLEFKLQGRELGGPIRTRSKLAKQLVAEALGYRIPSSFKRTKPRFPGQDLDVHVQQDDNLQIWNQEIAPERRYVLIRPDASHIVRGVRVVRGQQVAVWDRTGTLTSKFQAKRRLGRSGTVLVSESDTGAFKRVFEPTPLPGGALWDSSSASSPTRGLILPITQVFERAVNLIGARLEATGPGQDRIRGELLQRHVSDELGIGEYANFGQWPDILQQVLEVKLQTSPTIDLGLILPTDTTLARALGRQLRHCDARYLVVYGQSLPSGEVELQSLVLSTGVDFFMEFVQFGGLVKNQKRQIRLPRDLF